MSWARAKIRQGAVLALFALALQLLLSFGHVHAGGFAGHLTAGPAQAALSAPTTPGHDPDSTADDVCAICVTIAMADALLLAAPPTLSPPATFVVTRTRITSHAVRAQSPRTAFRSRAPPVLIAIV